jgi:hypothetical protein
MGGAGAAGISESFGAEAQVTRIPSRRGGASGVARAAMAAQQRRAVTGGRSVRPGPWPGLAAVP